MSDVKKRVVAIQGIPASPVAPVNGDSLVFNGTEYVPSSGGTVVSGDLAGTLRLHHIG